VLTKIIVGLNYNLIKNGVNPVKLALPIELLIIVIYKDQFFLNAIEIELNKSIKYLDY
jgi:hypothetical protein